MNSQNEFEKLPLEEKIYISYRDGGHSFNLHSCCELHGVSVEEAKAMIRRCYDRRETAGELQSYDKTI